MPTRSEYNYELNDMRRTSFNFFGNSHLKVGFFAFQKIQVHLMLDFIPIYVNPSSCESLSIQYSPELCAVCTHHESQCVASRCIYECRRVVVWKMDRLGLVKLLLLSIYFDLLCCGLFLYVAILLPIVKNVKYSF